jgi:hypothetical protein
MVHLFLFTWTLKRNGVLVVGNLAVGIADCQVVSFVSTFIHARAKLMVRPFVDGAEEMRVGEGLVCFVDGGSQLGYNAMVVNLELELLNVLFILGLR